MRRFDVYFLQKRGAGGWETLERARSASVLIASMVQAFDGEDIVELRVVAGDWNGTTGEWEFSQIFFVDRGSIDLQLAETLEDADETDGDPATQPQGGAGFAAEMRAADEQTERMAAGPEPEFGTSPPDMPEAGRDVRSLGFVHGDPDAEIEEDPVRRFRPEPQRRGRAFLMFAALLVAVLLIAGSAAALMVAFKIDPAPRYIGMFNQWWTGVGWPVAGSGETGAPVRIMPQTVGQVANHPGVAPELRGRWSSGDCANEYIEFDVTGFVLAASGGSAAEKILIEETLIDDETWYLRRSDTLIEHFQRLGDGNIRMIGDTTPDGFTQRISEALTRCP